MHHFFVSEEQIADGQITITGADVNHIKNVLRLRPGENLRISSRAGVSYLCQAEEITAACVTAAILEREDGHNELPAVITLYQCLPKADKMELIIQKAVELGVARIVPVASKRCVVKLDKKKEQARLLRWNGIAESAAKQSMRSRIPEVGPILSFHDAVAEAAAMDVKLIPYENAKGMAETKRLIGTILPGMSAAVMIGPEGGFEEAEIAEAAAKGLAAISLGRRILRTETAGLAVLSILMYSLEQDETISD